MECKSTWTKSTHLMAGTDLQNIRAADVLKISWLVSRLKRNDGMKLTDLAPRWVGAGGEGISDKDGNPVPERHGVGVSFDCPCGCASRCFIGFANLLDGGPAVDPRVGQQWQRAG